MNMRRTGATLGCAIAGMLLMAGSSQARVCQGNAELQGAFGFTASRFGLVGSPLAFTGAFTGTAVTPPGTTTPGGGVGPGTGPGTGMGAGQPGTGTPPAAFTGVGGLVTGAAFGEPFARTGTVFADGAGNLFLDITQAQQVGTFTVNPDCSVSVSLNNVFAFTPVPVTPPGTTGDTQTGAPTTGMGQSALVTASTVTFEGVLVEGGEEVDLVQTGTFGGTSMTWRRTFNPGACSNNDLNGDFGIVGNATIVTRVGAGVSIGNTTFTPFAIAGRLRADGAGNFSTDAFSIATTNPQAVLAGTYTVNPNCTGTAQVTSASGTTSALDFVLVREFAVVNRVAGATSSVVVQPVMYFDLTGAGVIGTGSAKPQ